MIQTCILFAKEAGDIDPSSVKEPPAPTIFTGERILGTFSICHIPATDPVFDTVDIVLRGLSDKH